MHFKKRKNPSLRSSVGERKSVYRSSVNQVAEQPAGVTSRHYSVNLYISGSFVLAMKKHEKL